jgi:hypothetical protein
MNRTQHHDKAEELLSDARTEPDSFRRRLILAEAQVHATLALSAPAGTSPPGREQTQTGGTAGTGGRLPGWPEGGVGFDPQPHAPGGERTPGHRYPPGEHPLRRAEERRASTPPAPPPVTASPSGPEPSTTRPAYPLGWKRPEEPPQEPEPDPEEQSPAAGDPGKQDPGAPTPFRMT